VRGTLFNQDWLEINLSFNLTTPVRNDRERSGMPDLRSTVELGPSFDFHLFRSDNRRVKFDLRMPLRYAATVESSPRIIGWTFSPRFNVDLRDPFGLVGWDLGLLAGPLFADHRYHDYFYSVALSLRTPRGRNFRPRAVTPEHRPWRLCRNDTRSFGWAHICAMTRWPALLLLTARWFSAKAIGRADSVSPG